MISQLNEQLRRIVVSGTIREESSSQFLEQITLFESVDISKPISVYIDTYGGSVDSALAMYDTIKSCCCPIITVGIGKVMSSGVLLLAAGDRGARFITENTRVMIHEVSSGVIGSVSEMKSLVDETTILQNIYVDILAKETGTRKDKILEDMQCETYMAAAEAIKYGISDKIVSTKKIVKKFGKGASTKKNTLNKKRSK